MRLQKEGFTCGPATAANALRAMGVRVTEELIRELARTTEDGTDEHGIIRALKKLGYSCQEVDTYDADEAWRWVTSQIRIGRPVIVCVENFSHWSAVIALLGLERVIYVDPARTEKNKRENGVRSLTRRGLNRIWGSRGRGKRRRYYAISVSE